MKDPQHRIVLFFFILVGCSFPAAGEEPAELRVHPDQTLRLISPRCFGGGTEFSNRYFELAMKHPQSRELITETVGFLRFPHGTSGQHYFWDDPESSYNRRKNPLFMTPGYIVGICRKLKLQPVFQVNTYQYRRSGAAKDFEESKVLLAPGNVQEAAQYAANWVRACREKKYNIRWWEIGNEDWVYWNGYQYGAIANAYARAMKQSDPSIRILLQGKTDTWKGKFQRTCGPEWMRQLLEAVDRELFDAVSVHLYLNGTIVGADKRPLPDETATMLARVDLAQRERFLRDFIRKNNLKWEIWITEFNYAKRDPDGVGGLRLMQNVAHGLVVADWVGRMLELGVDRLAPHDLTGHPCFEQIDIGKWTTPDKPHYTVPGLALTAFGRHFGRRMVKVSWRNNPPRFTSEISDPKYPTKQKDKHEYPAFSAYAALRKKDNTLRIVLMNRDLEKQGSVRLNLAGISLQVGAVMEIMELGGDVPLDATNIQQANRVAWRHRRCPTTENPIIKIQPHSVNIIKIPLEDDPK
ncbi:MAG: hypothetical protein JXA11_10205 [Phycisphaerae bacterium]|nr:hypothetical protein [Phycisphaerae bacterium]